MNTKEPSQNLKNEIKSLADEIATKVSSGFAKSQYTNELRKDLEQDLWLEYYLAKSRMPDLSMGEIISLLKSNKYGLKSIPDSRMSLRAENAEGVDLPDGYKESGGQIYRTLEE